MIKSWAKFWTGLGLVQDHKDRTKIKGMNHILPTFIGVGIFLVLASNYLWFNPWHGVWGTLVWFFLSEVWQEYNMRYRRKAYPLQPWRWWQGRHQDYIIPTVFAVIGVSTYVWFW